MINTPKYPGGDMLLKAVYQNGMDVEMRADGFSQEMFTVRCGNKQRSFSEYVDADIYFENSVISFSQKH
jgi:hypothetical protein